MQTTVQELGSNPSILNYKVFRKFCLKGSSIFLEVSNFVKGFIWLKNKNISKPLICIYCIFKKLCNAREQLHHNVKFDIYFVSFKIIVSKFQHDSKDSNLQTKLIIQH